MKHSVKDWFMATRPWALTASVMPVLVTLALLFYNNSVTGNPLHINWLNSVLAIIGIMILHSAGNLLSDYYDYKQGVDTADNDFGARTLVTKQFQPHEIRNFGLVLLLCGIILGLFLTYNSGLHLLWIGATGILAVLLYSKMKFNYLGDLCIFTAFGLMPPLGTAYVATGHLFPYYFIISVPIGFLTLGILHSNNTRDIERDSKAGIHTFAMALGLKNSIIYYYILVIIPFIWNIVFALLGDLPLMAILVVLVFPTAYKNLKTMSTAKDNIENINFLDLSSARLQMLFGITFIIGLLIAVFLLRISTL